MAITIKPSNHGANLAKHALGWPPRSPETVLRDVIQQQQGYEPEIPVEIIQSSLSLEEDTKIDATTHGFLSACISAYSKHYHLTIRPEDIWFAILTQFNTYVNAHGEELRDHFVAHEGQKDLKLHYHGKTRFDVDYAVFAKDMSFMLKGNIKDPSLHDWVIPSFSTTTQNDVVVACIAMMSTLQTYFKYYCYIDCGIPSVTLLGEKADYETILRRLDRLEEFGDEPARFATLLRPVLRHFVRSFEDPEAPDVIAFWQHIYKHIPNGSGDNTISGWITAFCFWDEQGQCLYIEPHRYGPASETDPFVTLDGVTFHRIREPDIPCGWCKVPVTIVELDGNKIESWMLGGSVMVKYESSGQEAIADDQGTTAVGLDSIRPQNEWFMFTGGYPPPSTSTE